MRRARVRLVVILLFVFALAAVVVFADWLVAHPPDAQAKYVGRNTCAECHQEQYHTWTGSHHDLAMDLATAETVLFPLKRIAFQFLRLMLAVLSKPQRHTD